MQNHSKEKDKQKSNIKKPVIKPAESGLQLNYNKIRQTTTTVPET